MSETIYQHGELEVTKSSDRYEYDLVFTQRIPGEDEQSLEVNQYDFEAVAEKLGWHSDENYEREYSRADNAEADLGEAKEALNAAADLLAAIADSVGGRDGRSILSILTSRYADPIHSVRTALEELDQIMYDRSRISS